MITSIAVIDIIGIIILISVVLIFISFTNSQSSREISTLSKTCDHHWEPDYNSKEVQRIYNDGFNAVVYDYVCTKCGKTKRDKDNPYYPPA